MKRLFIVAAVLMMAAVAYAADMKISQLPAVSSVADTDQFVVNQGGVSKKETLLQIKTNVLGESQAQVDTHSNLTGTNAHELGTAATYSYEDFVPSAHSSETGSNVHGLGTSSTQDFSYVDIRSTATITAADADAQTLGMGLVCASTYTLSSSVTITSHFTAIPGCMITESGTAGITFVEHPAAGDFQWLSGFESGDIAGLKNPIPEWWGAVGDGTTNDTTPFEIAYAAAVAGGGEMQLLPKTYKVKVTFNGEAPVRGSGPRRTVLVPADESSYVVWLYGSGGDSNLGATLSNLSIEGTGSTTICLKGGESAGSGFSNGLVERLEISGCVDNFLINQSIMGTIRQVWSHDGTYGLRVDSENNVTTLNIESSRFTTNHYGIKLESGHVITMTGVVSESNRYRNLWLYSSITGGPTKVSVIGSWFEDVGSAGTYTGGASVYFDMQSAIADTKPMDVLFSRSVIASSTGNYDIDAQRVLNATFDHCAFTAPTSGGLTSSKLNFASGNNSAKVKMIQCGAIQSRPTPSIYSSFPALAYGAGGPYGFLYEFEHEGVRYTNNYGKSGTLTALYDFDEDGGTGTISLLGLPRSIVLTSAKYEVLSALTSSGTATISFGIESDGSNDILTPTAYNDSAFDIGYHDFIPDGTSANFTTKTTDARNLIMTLSGDALTGGKIRVWSDYIVSEYE